MLALVDVGKDSGSAYAVGGTWWKTGVALAADHLLAVVLGRKSLKGGLNDTTTETEHQVEGGFLVIKNLLVSGSPRAFV